MTARSLVLVLLLAFTATALADGDLSSVRYRREGSGHMYLSTQWSVPIGDREASLSLYLLDGRYVATYSESKRKSASESEVLLQREIAGSAAINGGSATLGNLGTLAVTNETKNGKPVVQLVLGQPIASAPQGLAMRLIWVYGSWAPKSVTQ